MITITLPEWIATVVGILLTISLAVTVLAIFTVAVKVIYQYYEDYKDRKRSREYHAKRGNQ